MISFDFDYYRPTTINEAVSTFERLSAEGKAPIYYAGGTEIISLARMDRITFGAAIDIKEIPECNVLDFHNDKLIIGAAVTLSKISEAGIFPLLGQACKAAADHTARDKVTVGGNICGKTPYKEAVLPFLLSDSQAVIASTNGIRNVPLEQVFNESLQLGEGEFLVQLAMDKSYTTLPYVSKKRTKYGRVDYPLVTIAALKKDSGIRLAVSGLCSYPFRSQMVESELENKNIPADRRIDNAVIRLPGSILNDIQGSAEYREFVFRNMLADTLAELEGV